MDKKIKRLVIVLVITSILNVMAAGFTLYNNLRTIQEYHDEFTALVHLMTTFPEEDFNEEID